MQFSQKLEYTYININKKEDYNLNNMDINKLLAAISKMDKEELEKNIYKAQTILENSNLNNNLKNNDKDEN